MAGSPLSSLLIDLCEALLGCGEFAPGRPGRRHSLDRLTGELRDREFLCVSGGETNRPGVFRVWDHTAERWTLDELLGAEGRIELLPLFAGFWRDRGLALLSFRAGLLPAEMDVLLPLLSETTQRGDAFRRVVDETQAQGRLKAVGLLFAQELPGRERNLSSSVSAALGWLQKDLNLLSRCSSLDIAAQSLWRQGLVPAVLRLPQVVHEQTDFLGNLDLIADRVDGFNRDELAALLLDSMSDDRLLAICCALCRFLGALQKKHVQGDDEALSVRLAQVSWVCRRTAELLIEKDRASAELYHALVLHKVYVYEEIPEAFREEVASFQVLTSFLENPLKYFSQIENNTSPEVLGARLWRLLEMLPHMLRIGRCDVARDVLEFSQRFGPSFDIRHRSVLLDEMQSAAAQILTKAGREKQKALLEALSQMGPVGGCLLIQLTDHKELSVRRAALDGLAGMGQAAVPLLFERLECASGWHYLRNMLVLLTKVGAGGPKVENLFRKSLQHAEANVRKEALPGLARLLRAEAADLVAGCLQDEDTEVRRRAIACLSLTGIRDERIYGRLAALLGGRGGSMVAEQVVATLNQLRPSCLSDPALENALLRLLAGRKVLGVGRHKDQVSAKLKLGIVKALGCLGTRRSEKMLQRLARGSEAMFARAAQEALVSLRRT